MSKAFSLCPLFLFIFLFGISIQANESITGRHAGYREICLRASKDPYYLQNFRSMPAYRQALELVDADPFADYLRFSAKRWFVQLDEFRKLDSIGNPPLKYYPELGFFTGTTLRYIVLADQITKMFSLPQGASIAEIGAGFGGQCYILSRVHPFSHYYIFDLPEVEALISKMMDTLEVKNVTCVPIEESLSEQKIDLVISNYAYSECDRAMQLEYFDKVIKKADRGYVIYNQISQVDYGIDSLSPDEFVQLLKSIGAKPKVMKEILSTGAKNLLITWDKTKKARGGNN